MKNIKNEIFLIDTVRISQIRIAEEICNIIHHQINLILGLQHTQNQREYIADLCQAILDVSRSFGEEKAELIRGVYDDPIEEENENEG